VSDVTWIAKGSWREKRDAGGDRLVIGISLENTKEKKKREPGYEKVLK